MAKPLRQHIPTSSVAHLLDLSSAARAVSIPEDRLATESTVTVNNPPLGAEPLVAQSPNNQGPPSHTRSVSRKHTSIRPLIKREFVLTPGTDKTVDKLVDIYRNATSSKLTASHVLRAVLRGVEHAMDQVEREARRIGEMRLPANARGFEHERDRFEARIADAFLAAMRAAAAFDSGQR